MGFYIRAKCWNDTGIKQKTHFKKGGPCYLPLQSAEMYLKKKCSMGANTKVFVCAAERKLVMIFI